MQEWGRSRIDGPTNRDNSGGTMTPPVQAPQQNGMPPTNMGGADAAQEAETRQWAMILHLSLLGGLVVPLFGLVAPILIWQLKKDEMPGLDAHGKMVANWVISAFIYAVVGAVLSLVLIGILLLMALGVVSIVFPIIGGIKAKDGELWKYPLTIQFLK